MSFLIGFRCVGAEDGYTYIIAEAGANHCGDYGRAVALVHAAAAAGADAIKFQTYTPEELAADIILPMHCQETALAGRKLRDLFHIGGLPRAWHRSLKEETENAGMAFLSTPFSVEAAKFLVEEVGVPAVKVASGDLTFEPLLEYLGRQDKPILLSTGASDLSEIWWALQGPIYQAVMFERLALLHCVSTYPCPPESSNLKAIETMVGTFPSVVVGWSDHTTSDDVVPTLAVAYGARIIEKHLCLKTDDPEGGHALVPDHFKRMVDMIRLLPKMLGSGKKVHQAIEEHDRLWARRDPSDYLRPTKEAREGRWC